MPAQASEETVRVGLYQNEPVIFTDSDGVASGISVDIIEYIASEEGWEIEYVPCTWPEGLEKLESGEIDLLTDIAYTEERSKVFDYTEETFQLYWGQVYVREDVEIKTILDLEGKTIVGVKNSIDFLSLGSQAESYGVTCNYIAVEDYTTVLKYVEDKKADAGVVARSYGSYNEMNYAVQGTPIETYPIELYFAVPKNTNPGVIKAIDKHMSEMKADSDSVYYQSRAKWIQDESEQEVPPWVKPTMGVGGGLLILFMVSAFVFKNQVNNKTTELFVINKELKKEITERKQAENVLRESEEIYRSIFQTAANLITSVNKEGIIVDCNDRVEEILGYKKDEVIGSSMELIMHPAYHESAQLHLKEILDKGFCYNHEYEMVRKDGKIIDVSINSAGLTDETGEYVRTICIIEDITQRKNLDRMKDEFLSNVGHELKTPLVSIIGYNELMCDETLGPLTSQQKKAMEAVVRNSDRLRRLIDSLLYLSLEKAGKVNYAFKPLYLDEIVENVVVRMVSQAVKKGISIESDIPENLPLVDGDKDYIIQALNNLIDNAIKFTPSGGQVIAAVRPQNDGVHIEIKDTGIGISEDRMEDLFKLFHQLDGSTTRRYEGTGLGLYICKSIIDMHKGNIWMESEEGAGTTVHITLPISDINQ